MTTPPPGHPIQFGRLPFDVIDAGALAEMTGAAAKVYAAIIAHVRRPDDWTCHPRVERLAELTGLDRRTAQRALVQLADLGVISVKEGGGRGLASRYTVTTNGGAITALHDGNSGTHAALCKPEREASASRKCGVALPKGRRGAPKTAAPTPPQEKEEKEQTTTERASADADAAAADCKRAEKPAPEILRELNLAGIVDPARTELVTAPGITAGMVRRAVKLAREKNLDKPGGVVVVLRGLLTEAENHRREGEKRRSRQQRLDQEMINRREKAHRERREAEEARDEISRAATEYLATHGAVMHNGTTETDAEAGDDHPEVEAVGLCPTGGSSRPRRQRGPARPFSTTSLENSQ